MSTLCGRTIQQVGVAGGDVYKQVVVGREDRSREIRTVKRCVRGFRELNAY